MGGYRSVGTGAGSLRLTEPPARRPGMRGVSGGRLGGHQLE